MIISEKQIMSLIMMANDCKGLLLELKTRGIVLTEDANSRIDNIAKIIEEISNQQSERLKEVE